ncbi:MAG TPA: LysR family transcriptional regulator [Bradyrhizobium sp.]|jgi:DNA-binding transcriptional LysR family regulator|uniref:LysR family transcriptional regulator n=1 Tax=Bradyrhizobium sp. TaxID=376 RepID=UPI002B45EFDD|nr:LysR family transcriptional regulator [Bradyrhizobium sp.]HKO73026.1 LysR family transcriptional regulator [Bradyrhizobium sp.]
MDKIDLSWDLYRTFLAVFREGSFSKAARGIGISQPTASRHIEVLEAAIGARLFARRPGGLVPTEAARELLSDAEAMAAAAGALQRASSGGKRDERGIVRLTAAELIGHEVLPDILSPFCQRYPSIVLELKLSNRNEDVLRGDADIAIRMARPSQQALLARRIGVVKLGLFAHRSYVAVFGTPKTPADISGHRLIGFDKDQYILRSADGGAPPPSRAQFGFRCDSAPMQAAALRAGIGIGSLHLNTARRDANLIRVLEKSFTFTREMWLVMHEDAKATRRVRLLFDHLVEGLTAYVKEN